MVLTASQGCERPIGRDLDGIRILPVLPFLVLIMTFLAELNGCGGFEKKHDGGIEFSRVPIDCKFVEQLR
ncbi:unnamed protein product [Cylicocyclus nassatus]|uniref:Uncharacterized protein n=1 Tax=Cylicocyclus nassatus TaxID=53992 RepID=A0AA36HHT1_CYLNA|nr:unnamed protein product [Cylicocyclus nassatus]